MAKPQELGAEELAAVARRLDRLGQEMAPGARRPASFPAIADAIREKTGVKMTGQTVANMSRGVPGTYAREKLTTLERFLGETVAQWIAEPPEQLETPPQPTVELDERYPIVAIVLGEAKRGGWSDADIEGARDRMKAFKGEPSDDDVWQALRASRAGHKRAKEELAAVDAAERKPNLVVVKKKAGRGR